GFGALVKEKRTKSVLKEFRPSDKNVGLKATTMSSPRRAATIASSACASSPVPASKVSWPSVKAMRTGVLRSATTDTRRTASISSLVRTVAWIGVSLGNSERIFGYSPLISKEVVRRLELSKPTISPFSPKASFSSPEFERVLATSLRVFALIRKEVEISDLFGDQFNSRSARR